MRVFYIQASEKLIGDFTNFEKRVWYETHNVTALLKSGQENVVGLTLAPGWDSRHGTGKEGIEILLRLSVDLEGGDHIDVVSDPTFTAGSGALVAADVYNGETFIANRSTPGWSTPSFKGRFFPSFFL